MSTPKVPELLLERVRQGNRFLLTSHINPDGDAVGSAVGFARILRQIGKGGVVWLRDTPPRIYSSLPGYENIHVGTEPPAGFPEAFTAGIVLECPSLERCGIDEHLAAIDLINIDHHLGNDQYGVVNWVDTAAPSVGEMIFRLARALHLNLDSDTADALYMTLVTDTGGFRFSNATPLAFDAAGELVREGASPERVSGWLYESQPEAAIRLLGAMLESLEMHHGGRVATAWLTHEMLEKSGAGPGDSEGLIDYPRSIAGVDAVAMFRQLDDGRHKVSLRSRGTINVERVARAHGGGGHRNAAGFTAEIDSSELQQATVDALIATLAPS